MSVRPGPAPALPRPQGAPLKMLLLTTTLLIVRNQRILASLAAAPP
jgi:hypothetical protein